MWIILAYSALAQCEQPSRTNWGNRTPAPQNWCCKARPLQMWFNTRLRLHTSKVNTSKIAKTCNTSAPFSTYSLYPVMLRSKFIPSYFYPEYYCQKIFTTSQGFQSTNFEVKFPCVRSALRRVTDTSHSRSQFSTMSLKTSPEPLIEYRWIDGVELWKCLSLEDITP